MDRVFSDTERVDRWCGAALCGNESKLSASLPRLSLPGEWLPPLSLPGEWLWYVEARPWFVPSMCFQHEKRSLGPLWPSWDSDLGDGAWPFAEDREEQSTAWRR